MNPADVLSATIFTSGWTYVFFGLFGLWKRKRAQGMTAEAVGKVTTRAKWWDIEDPQVKVEFRAKTGEMVTFSTDRRRYQIGDSVDVIYDPADCKYARVNDGNPVHPQVQLVVFVLLILIGLGWKCFDGRTMTRSGISRSNRTVRKLKRTTRELKRTTSEPRPGTRSALRSSAGRLPTQSRNNATRSSKRSSQKQTQTACILT